MSENNTTILDMSLIYEDLAQSTLNNPSDLIDINVINNTYQITLLGMCYALMLEYHPLYSDQTYTQLLNYFYENINYINYT